MNIDWINFLKSNNATVNEASEIIFPENHSITHTSITAISHLAIIQVTGKDSVTFLQGQLTCNVKEITNSNSFFAAFCNAKGRTISTLLILKNASGFLIILPNALVKKVIQKLNMYILRADVQLDIVSDEHCLIGITSNDQNLTSGYPVSDFSVVDESNIIIKLPAKENRYLLICSLTNAQSFWSQFQQNDNTSIKNSSSWLYQDISAGMAWLSETTSEQYIPQMLNIDKLGGISFSKGCYTGQEIVARTHYLGKSKRELFVAECDKTIMLNNDIQNVTDQNMKSIGNVLSIQSNDKKYKLLIVIPTTEANSKNLLINNSNPAKITIIDFE